MDDDETKRMPIKDLKSRGWRGGIGSLLGHRAAASAAAAAHGGHAGVGNLIPGRSAHFSSLYRNDTCGESRRR